MANMADKGQLLALTIQAISQYRLLLQRAEEAHEQWIQAKSLAGSEQSQLVELERAYVDSLRLYSAQATTVASLTDQLGYIPDVSSAPLSDEE